MTNVKEKSVALKSRQTKLSKKTKEELIEVILRKDKVERNQINQISKFKGEINSLQSRLNNYISDTDGHLKAIKELKDRNKALNELIDCKNSDIKEITCHYNKIEVENKNRIKLLNKISISLLILYIITLVCFILK
ncbi:hypothetical protein [Clostridium sp.]|uniref:hypothetical protein n=1 Tax=Clostridium sp. TaxID=1506 RepID=UPI0025BC14BC|nr:hypothetical protein [Clostridium sp.]